MNLRRRLDQLEAAAGHVGPAFVIDSAQDYERAKEVFDFVCPLELFNHGKIDRHACFGDRPYYQELIEEGVIVETERYRESRSTLMQLFNAPPGELKSEGARDE